MNIELYELCLPKSESAPTALYIRTEGTVTRTAKKAKNEPFLLERTRFSGSILFGGWLQQGFQKVCICCNTEISAIEISIVVVDVRVFIIININI